MAAVGSEDACLPHTAQGGLCEESEEGDAADDEAADGDPFRGADAVGHPAGQQRSHGSDAEKGERVDAHDPTHDVGWGVGLDEGLVEIDEESAAQSPGEHEGQC